MKKMIAVMAFGALAVGSIAMARPAVKSSEEGVDQAQVDAKIDARLHDLLIVARLRHL